MPSIRTQRHFQEVAEVLAAAPEGPPDRSAAAAAPNVGFLDSVSGHGPEHVPTAVTTKSTMNNANLLVAMVAADGPDSPATQQVVLSDNRHHTWSLRQRDVVFGSIIDVFTAPAQRHAAGTVVTSRLTVHDGDDGQALTLAARSNGHFYDTTSINGHYGFPRDDQNMPPHTDTYTVFVDGRTSYPVTLLPGEHPVNVFPVPSGEDLYQISHTDVRAS